MTDDYDYGSGLILPALPRYHGPFGQAVALSSRLRSQVPRGRAVLYHGTRYPQRILREDALSAPEVGLPIICFSRALHIGAHYALLPREDDEGRGAVFVLDRDALRRRYRLDVRDERFPGQERETGGGIAEEAAWYEVIWDLRSYLVTTIWLDPAAI